MSSLINDLKSFWFYFKPTNKNLNVYILPFFISQPLAFIIDVTIDNQFLTGIGSGLISIATVYIVNKFKK